MCLKSRCSVKFVIALLIADWTAAVSASASQVQDASVVESPQPTLQQRLTRLCEQLERKRETLHVSGMAIAVVKDDAVILSRGFGMRDVENNLQASDDTLYAIGSATKAFTATLVGMMIDEGKMSWDDSPRKFLPYFHLKDQTADEQITIRDLLCHRSGLARTDLLWASGKVSRDDILHTIAEAELYSPFREKFNYNNVMVMAAGEAVAQVAGTDWDALVTNRLLIPLGMSSSNTTLQAAKQNPMLSKGYTWDDDASQYRLSPMRDLSNIAPAGAINSTASDMAQWLRFQLAKGAIGGKRLVSEDRITETWTKQIVVAGDTGYGLGWMLNTWNKHRFIEHGGNIDGFSAQVAFLPDDGVGFVLLTNAEATPLQSLCVNTVFDSLLGSWSDEKQLVDPAVVQPYLGKYHFEKLNVDVTVLIQNGRLAVDVPGQMVFELKPPDDTGKWAFDFPKPVAVSFEPDEKSRINLMKLYQAGLEFELPRVGYTPPREVDPEAVQKYLGVYHFQPRNEDWTVVIHNGRLAVDVPKQMVFDLRGPDDKDIWTCRASDSMKLKFNADDNGAVSGMTFFQGLATFDLARAAAAPTTSLPSADDLAALHARACGSEHLESIRTIRMTGVMKFVNQGLTGAITLSASGLDHFQQFIDLEKFGFIKLTLNGDSAWTDSTFHSFESLNGEKREQTRLQHPLMAVAPWSNTFSEVHVLREETIEGHKTYVVELSADKSLRCTAFLDADSGLVYREEWTQTVKGVGAITMRMTYDDFRDVSGVQLPFRIVVDNDISGKMCAQINDVQINVHLGNDAFDPPTGRNSPQE